GTHHGTSMKPSLRLTVLAAVAAATACSDSLRPPELPRVPAIVSAPVPVSVVRASRQGPSARVMGGQAAAFVALPTGSFPSGVTATITNRATGLSRDVAIVDGGFDPVPIAADEGDTLEVTVAGEGGTLAHATAVVPHRRAPLVIRTFPGQGHYDVPLNCIVIVVFNEPIDPATVSDASVELFHGVTPVGATLRFADSAHVSIAITPATLL